MAEEPQQGAINAAFPAPPPFYKSFTPENLERLRQSTEPSSEEGITQTRSLEPHLVSTADFPSIPAEIRNLVPPAPPTDGKYRSFGTSHDVNPPPPAPRDIPTRENLLGLTDRLMQLFERYVQIMAKNPSGELWVPQWEEIKKTFEQMHGVINEYRPHEARENLILRYEDQIAQVREESERAKTSIEKARKMMEGLAKEAPGPIDKSVNGHKETRNGKNAGRLEKKDLSQTRERIMWDIIENEVGRA